MRSSIFSGSILPFCIAAFGVVTNGCGSGNNYAHDTQTAGTISVPLITTNNGVRYRLSRISLFIEGPLFQFLSENNPDEQTLSATLQTGDYVAELESFSLERDDGEGHFRPIQATLVSAAAVPFTIFNRTTTTITYRFQTDGIIVNTGSGQLDVAIAVDQVPGRCTPFGGGCAEGSWCAPTGLTGTPLACIPAGSVAVGQPCSKPSDCVSDASCFDFGDGPSCSALCSPAQFHASCGGGGECLPAGTDYGVCRPGPAGDGGGGSFPACAGLPPVSAEMTGAFASPVTGTFAFAAPGLPSPTIAPTFGPDGTVQSYQVTVGATIATDPNQAFVGVGLAFGSPPCLDASAFTAVRFTVTGDLGTCTLRFSVVPSEDNSVNNSAVGTCTAAICSGPFSQPLTTGVNVVRFADLANGSPLSTVDAHALNDIGWLLGAPSDGTTPACSASFTLSDIAFVNDAQN